MEAPKRLITSFRRKRNNSKKMAPSTTTTETTTADEVVKPRENYLSPNGRAMSYSGPYMLSDMKPFEGAPPRHPSNAVHLTPFQLDNQDRRRSKRNGERRNNGENDGVHEDEESTTPVAVISVRRSERGIAGLQTLREHRELLMEQRLSLPREHPRSTVHHEEKTDKKGQHLAWEPLGRSDNIK